MDRLQEKERLGARVSQSVSPTIIQATLAAMLSTSYAQLIYQYIDMNIVAM